MPSDYKFQGWLGLDKEAANGKMVWQEYEPKKFEDSDVDIKITHCGICGSDIHTLRSGWGPSIYPCCVGHEIVGTIVRAGPKVENGLKVGDRVGVGAQCDSCRQPDCEECSDNMENVCLNKNVSTYSSRHKNGDIAYGGYADYWRGPSHFVIKIPDSIPSDIAAPMLCGGVTAFNPLVKNGAGPNTRVGIVGIGGLGHFGILGAKALGCKKIVAISRTSSKKEDALQMGATDFIATDEDKQWNRKHRNSLDLIISTVSSPNMPLTRYLQLLRPHGQFIQVGAPEDVLPPIKAAHLFLKNAKIGGSAIGSPQDIREMLDLFAEKGVKTWNQNIPMKNANQAIVDMEAGKARYRYVLVNEKHNGYKL